LLERKGDGDIWLVHNLPSGRQVTNHVHLIFRSTGTDTPDKILGDFKRFTSRSIIDAIENNPRESRKEFMLTKFKENGAKTSNTTKNQFWRHDNKPIELWSNKVIDQTINCVHNNPVEERIIVKPEDYKYSSAVDYLGSVGE
jgi:REP element-mobilizing transposase RayT